MNRDKTLILVEAVTLYSLGLDHTGSMDDLTVQCTEGEWKFVCDALSRAYEIMAGATNSHDAQIAALTAERDSLRAKVLWLESSIDVFTAANEELTFAFNLAGETCRKLEAERDGLRELERLAKDVADYIRDTSWSMGPIRKLVEYIDNKDKENKDNEHNQP